MCFQVFSFASKKVQGFSSDDRKILMSLFSVLFHLQNCVSVFEILIFSEVIWGNVHYIQCTSSNFLSEKFTFPASLRTSIFLNSIYFTFLYLLTYLFLYWKTFIKSIKWQGTYSYQRCNHWLAMEPARVNLK